MMQQPSYSTPDSQASSSQLDSAGADRSAARILMQLNHNYMKLEDDSPSKEQSAASPAAEQTMAQQPPPTQQQQPQQQKRPVRDPSSHRESEKRRRERFNASLAELRDLVPKCFVSKSCQNKVRLEKTEVINSAINYIKHLKANLTGAVNNNNKSGSNNVDKSISYRPSFEASQLAWQEEFKKKAALEGVIYSDDIFYPNNNLISGGQSILARPNVSGEQQQMSASDMLQDLSTGSNGRARQNSCASSSSSATTFFFF